MDSAALQKEPRLEGSREKPRAVQKRPGGPGRVGSMCDPTCVGHRRQGAQDSESGTGLGAGGYGGVRWGLRVQEHGSGGNHEPPQSLGESARLDSTVRLISFISSWPCLRKGQEAPTAAGFSLLGWGILLVSHWQESRASWRKGHLARLPEGHVVLGLVSWGEPGG